MILILVLSLMTSGTLLYHQVEISDLKATVQKQEEKLSEQSRDDDRPEAGF